MQNISTRVMPNQAAAPKTSGLPSDRGIHMRPTHILASGIALLIMLALKYHYSLATADQLVWILAPTAKLLAWLTPAHPVYENGVGYVDFTQGIIVAPACAGINFMIMAFGLLTLCGLTRTRRSASCLAWPAMSLIIAFGYTILVNTARIILSMALYKADIYEGWITLERVHRLAGIGLYLGALWLLFTGAQIMVRHSTHGRRLRGSTLPRWLPFVWYILGAAGVPMANLLVRQRTPSFGEHIWTVLITVTCLYTISAILRIGMTTSSSFANKKMAFDSYEKNIADQKKSLSAIP